MVTQGKPPGPWARSSNCGHTRVREFSIGEALAVTGLQGFQQALHLSDLNPLTPIQAQPPSQGDSAPGSFPSCHPLRRVTGYHGDRKAFRFIPVFPDETWMSKLLLKGMPGHSCSPAEVGVR